MLEPILYTYSLEVLRIIDADSFIAKVDRGFYDFSIKTIRLARIDAPEMRGEEKAQGEIAKKWVEETLRKCDRLTMQSIQLDSFGRSIAEVWYWDKESWINLSDELLKQGLAKEYKKC